MLYKYHRMAENFSDWRRPVAGRLGKVGGYPGDTGFGHEDWNFARETWADGNYHLYLQGQPARTDRRETFQIVLGRYLNGRHLAVGFAENATYALSKLPAHLVAQRAKQLEDLDRQGELAGPLRGLTVAEKAAQMFADGDAYWVCVAPEDLILLEEPVPIQEKTVSGAYHRYQLKGLDEIDYKSIRHSAFGSQIPVAQDEMAFPEGRMIARTHLHRERDSNLIREAKKLFRQNGDGKLRCEACEWPRHSKLEGSPLADEVIEGHHDVPLAAPEYPGVTKVKDIRLLCPNCHRTIHRIRPWVSVEEFINRYLGR